MTKGVAAQHSQSLEAWFAHIPGLRVVTPSRIMIVPPRRFSPKYLGKNYFYELLSAQNSAYPKIYDKIDVN